MRLLVQPEVNLVITCRALLASAVAVALPATGAAQTPNHTADTLHLEVGAAQVDGRVYKPHAARVLIRIGDPKGPVVREWTNELTVGDSAGREVHRWVTKGQVNAGGSAGVTWELRQTYDAITLKPYQYNSTYSNGTYTRVTIDGNRVRGTRRAAGDTTVHQIDITIDRPGYFAGASDLVPAAVGFRSGLVMTAPVWNPSMVKAETRIFTVIGREDVDVEGTRINAWKVEERRADRTLYATWWLLDESPYMVYGEVPLANGQIQRMSEVEIPRSSRR
jgi:hypothetical protein